MAVHTYKLWLFIHTSYGCSYIQVMAVHAYKLWLFIHTSYGCSYIQVMAVHTHKLWLFIHKIYGCSSIQVMAVHTHKLHFHLLQKNIFPLVCLKMCHSRYVRSVIQSCSVCISVYTYSHEHNNIKISSDI